MGTSTSLHIIYSAKTIIFRKLLTHMSECTTHDIHKTAVFKCVKSKGSQVKNTLWVGSGYLTVICANNNRKKIVRPHDDGVYIT